MPTYNYLCTLCDHETEEFHLTYEDAEAPIDCSKCGQKAHKIFSRPQFILDGSDPNYVAAHDRWVKAHETQGNGTRSF